MTKDFNLKNTIEALLLSSDEPLSADRLYKIISNKENITKADILDSIKELENDYRSKEIESALNSNFSGSAMDGLKIKSSSPLLRFFELLFKPIFNFSNKPITEQP